MPWSKLLTLLAVGSIIVFTTLAYAPGLSGSFIFDDYPNIVNNDAIAIQDLSLSSLKSAAFSGTSGPLQRPVPMLSFSVNHYLSGFDSFWFKATNLFVHATNAILLFVLSSLLLRAYAFSRAPHLSNKYIFWLSLGVALAWSLHPINLTSVLYIVQRMNSLAALFTILAMIAYASGRLRQLQGQTGWPWIISSLAVLTPLAVFSKENAILLPLFFGLIEGSLFGFKNASGRLSRGVTLLHVAIVAAFLAAALYLFLFSPDHFLGGYTSRDFTLYERLLTQTRALGFYVSQIAIPTTSQLGIYHDDFVVSKGLWDPPVTFWAGIGWLAVASAALGVFRYAPIPAFGILFYLLGHSVESTMFPLEMVHEHRNYLPSFGLIFAGLFLLTHPLVLQDTLRLRIFSSALLIGVLGFVTLVRADIWGDPIRHAISEADNHPKSPRANLSVGQAYVRIGLSDLSNRQVYFAGARGHFRISGRLDESFISGFFAEIFLDGKMDRPPASEVIDELATRLESKPFSSVTVNWVDALSACVVRNECLVRNEDMYRLISAAINNPTAIGRNRSELFVASSKYYFYAGDLDSAVYLASQAVDSNLAVARYRLNLVNILIAAGRLRDAKQELVRAAELDRFGLKTAEIERLWGLILDITGSEVKSP